MRTSFWRRFAFAAIATIVTDAVAQQPVRVRATIEQVDGNVLSLKARDGTPLKLVLADNAVVTAVMKRSLDDIKVGEFVGTAATLQDGTWKALEVHIFPESMRGTGEGHRPWELPQSSMTNATVTDRVKNIDGLTVTLRHKEGEHKIVVTEATPIVGYEVGERADLKVGRAIFVSGATKGEDGNLRAARISVEKTAPPPM
jgi:hypothetical protein